MDARGAAPRCTLPGVVASAALTAALTAFDVPALTPFVVVVWGFLLAAPAFGGLALASRHSRIFPVGRDFVVEEVEWRGFCRAITRRVARGFRSESPLLPPEAQLSVRPQILHMLGQAGLQVALPLDAERAPGRAVIVENVLLVGEHVALRRGRDGDASGRGGRRAGDEWMAKQPGSIVHPGGSSDRLINAVLVDERDDARGCGQGASNRTIAAAAVSRSTGASGPKLPC